KFPFSEELWTPIYNEFPPQPRGDLRLGASNNAPAVMGRLKSGVTLDQVNAEFIALAKHIAQDNPKTNQNFTSASVMPLLNAVTFLVTSVATVASGLVRGYLRERGNAAEIMKEGGRGNRSRLVNISTRVLVVGQIALTAALLIAATLQIKSIRNQTKRDYGYDENGVYAARMALMEGAYPSEDARREFFMRAVRAFRANPQFESAAMTDRFRMT